MTETRPLAVWLRSLASLVTLAGLLGLGGCGGGSGAPNNVFNTPGPLTVLPAIAVAYSGIPMALTVSGGTPPYKAFSSNSAAVPVAQDVAGSTIVIFAGSVAADTDVTITVQDNPAGIATPANTKVALTVRAAPLLNSLTITADSADCAPSSSSSTTAAATPAICSGQTGTASVTVLSPQGGPVAGRQVQFDVVSGSYAITTTNPAQPLVSSLKVTSDAKGVATVVIKANAGAPTQFAQLRATDLTSGQQLLGNFIIQQVIDGTKILTVVPPKATITGAFKGSCSSGFATDYFIYGGTPPYRVSSTFPTGATLVNSTVNVAGGSFTAITNGTCVNPLTFSIVDATGRVTTATLENVEGASDAPAAPAPALSATLSTPTPGNCAAKSFSVLLAGGTPPYSLTASPSGPFFIPSATPASGGYVSIFGLSDPNTYNFAVGDSSKPQQLASFKIVCPVP